PELFPLLPLSSPPMVATRLPSSPVAASSAPPRAPVRLPLQPPATREVKVAAARASAGNRGPRRDIADLPERVKEAGERERDCGSTARASFSERPSRTRKAPPYLHGR